MSKILVVAEQSGGELRKSTLHVINFAQMAAAKSGGTVEAMVIGAGIANAAAEVAKYGVSKVYAVDAPVFENYLAQSFSHAIAEVAKAAGATVVAGAASTFGKDVLPCVAVKLEAGMASDVTGMGEGMTYLRPMWAGNVQGEVEITTPIHVLSVRTAEFDSAPEAGAAPVEAFTSTFEAATLKQRLIEFKPTVSARPDLGEAGVVIAGGRGLKSKDNFGLVDELADLLGAAVGATRAAVDAEFIENDYQIGQTGKIIAPDLYIGMGISGAIQHLAGMKASKVIVAINKDEEAPIFSVADYGLVADLFKVVPELIEKIKAHKG
jgi:electron transfer flavoprotein alpha subunit